MVRSAARGPASINNARAISLKNCQVPGRNKADLPADGTILDLGNIIRTVRNNIGHIPGNKNGFHGPEAVMKGSPSEAKYPFGPASCGATAVILETAIGLLLNRPEDRSYTGREAIPSEGASDSFEVPGLADASAVRESGLWLCSL